MSILASGFTTNCMEFLDQAPQPPSKDSVQAAIDVLYEVGAIERTMGQQHGYVIHQTERLTPLGQHLAKLPVDVSAFIVMTCETWDPKNDQCRLL